MNFLIYHDDRGKTARAEAADDLDREQAIVGHGLVRADPGFFIDSIQNLFGIPDMTGCRGKSIQHKAFSFLSAVPRKKGENQ